VGPPVTRRSSHAIVTPLATFTFSVGAGGRGRGEFGGGGGAERAAGADAGHPATPSHAPRLHDYPLPPQQQPPGTRPTSSALLRRARSVASRIATTRDDHLAVSILVQDFFVEIDAVVSVI